MNTFTNQKKCTTTQNKQKKLKPGLNASYDIVDIQPGSGEGLLWFRRFINLSLVYLRRPTNYLQPRDSHGGDYYGNIAPCTLHCVSKKRPTSDLLQSLHTQFDYDNFWHKCCRESRQSKCTLFSHFTAKSQWTVLVGYLTISTNVRRYRTHHR